MIFEVLSIYLFFVGTGINPDPAPVPLHVIMIFKWILLFTQIIQHDLVLFNWLNFSINVAWYYTQLWKLLKKVR